MAQLGMQRKVKGTFDEVLGRVPEALKAEGFGVLTRIDVKATLKEKLGVDFRRYQILGACNPGLAHQALSTDLGIGVFLPCNVVVLEGDDGQVTVAAVDPRQTIGGTDPRFGTLAEEVRMRLGSALDRL